MRDTETCNTQLITRLIGPLPERACLSLYRPVRSSKRHADLCLARLLNLFAPSVAGWLPRDRDVVAVRIRAGVDSVWRILAMDRGKPFTQLFDALKAGRINR